MNRGGEEIAVRVVLALIEEKTLFRERDLVKQKISHNWLHEFPVKQLVRRHGHGVWGPRDYTPTRYEFTQTKFPKAVFWGPSALWLHGAEPEEPEVLWVAMKNERARADVSRANFHRMLERAAHREQFVLPPDASLLSHALPIHRWWHPIPAAPDEWTLK